MECLVSNRVSIQFKTASPLTVNVNENVRTCNYSKTDAHRGYSLANGASAQTSTDNRFLVVCWEADKCDLAYIPKGGARPPPLRSGLPPHPPWEIFFEP